jgi:NAD(P) transhydrogenase subunit alpha
MPTLPARLLASVVVLGLLVLTARQAWSLADTPTAEDPAATEKPVAPTEKPTASSEKPTATTEEAAPAGEKPTAATEEPAPSGEKPAETGKPEPPVAASLKPEPPAPAESPPPVAAAPPAPAPPRATTIAAHPSADTEAVINSIYILVLAGFVGFEVIGRVSPLLHTPLMSATNAISGISLVGSLVAAGSGELGTVSHVLGFVAVTAATINVVGGFLITDRMLRMFKLRGKGHE